MATQQVNAAKLKKAGNDLNDLSAKMKSEMNKLDENIQKVSSVWSSDASAAYVKKYNDNKANLDELVRILQEFGTSLNTFSQNYTQADNKATDLIGKYLGK
jgi:WXG100 family type VII secretion target